jgi:ubiquinone/menaquinone biosynthesis C-methylase UbiE
LENNLPSIFDHQAQNWDTAYRVERASAISEEIKKRVHFSPNDSVLEFGCGTGLISFNIIESVASLTLVDNSEGMLSVVKEKIRDLAPGKPVTLGDDIFSKNLPLAAFDCIYTSMVLHHINNIQETGKQFSRLLKENGVLCIVDLAPDDGSFHGADPDFDGHNGFDPEELSKEFEQYGFSEHYRAVFYSNTKEIWGRNVPYSLFILVMKNRTVQGNPING